jgi:hypothetical protein
MWHAAEDHRDRRSEGSIMTTLVLTYVVVWLTVVLYLVRLATWQHGLAKKLQSLQSRLDERRVLQDERSRPA